MMRLLCAGLCVAVFASVGRSAPPEPATPSDAAVIKAAALPPTGLQGSVTIVKAPLAPGQWKCTVYYTATELVRLPWGWVPAPVPRVREFTLELPGAKAAHRAGVA